MLPNPLYHSFVKGGEIAGSIAALSTVIGWLIRSAWRAGSGVVNVNKNVGLLMTNHLPHILGAIETVQRSQDQVAGDVKILKIGHTDIVKRFDELNGAFIQHLENASRESITVETKRVTLAKESNQRLSDLENVQTDVRLANLEAADLTKEFVAHAQKPENEISDNIKL
jgi:hypothetical protein